MSHVYSHQFFSSRVKKHCQQKRHTVSSWINLLLILPTPIILLIITFTYTCKNSNPWNAVTALGMVWSEHSCKDKEVNKNGIDNCSVGGVGVNSTLFHKIKFTGLGREQTSYSDLPHKLPRLHFYFSSKEDTTIMNYVFKMHIEQ